MSGAVTNLIFNLLLIPKLGALGAVLGTLFAELVACVVQFVVVRKSFELKKCFRNCFVYLCAGILMVVAVRLISNINVNVVLKIIIEIVTGGIVFILVAGIFIYRSQSKIFNELFSGIIKK